MVSLTQWIVVRAMVAGMTKEGENGEAGEGHYQVHHNSRNRNHGVPRSFVAKFQSFSIGTGLPSSTGRNGQVLAPLLTFMGLHISKNAGAS